jgi:hypothetical protein
MTPATTATTEVSKGTDMLVWSRIRDVLLLLRGAAVYMFMAMLIVAFTIGIWPAEPVELFSHFFVRIKKQLE